jgi:hypothetical protein
MSLYLSTTSVRDGFHVRDSFSLNNPAIRVHYLRTGHDTDTIVRANYPEQLISLIKGTFVPPERFLATADDVLKCLMLVDIGVAEMESRVSDYVRVPTNPRDYSAEYTHWQARQYARIGNIDEAIHWAWAAIIKSAPHVPDGFPETLGHIAFDNGRPSEALRAYTQVGKPSDEIVERLELLRKWNA